MPELFTTGAYICPVEQKDGRWRWGVFGFDGDTFEDGDMVSPKLLESANTLEKLVSSKDKP